MNEEIEKLLSNRISFLSILNQDIDTYENIFKNINNDIISLELTKQHIQELGNQPEHSALIPLCKKLYIPGKILHTGEFLTENQAHPNNYLILKTLHQTVKGIDDRINRQRQLLEKAELSVFQLEERKKLLLGGKDGDLTQDQLLEEDIESLSKEVALMPKEIKSDKGVAIKVGHFYEILEYEES
ncbi:hypothetical protein GWI33_000349 [Rhynchophorus ferrugineus]|uniref:Uncharacterized protein n=1 Tax=Rhynchophorus ferrugineus TaxID=354439 RepID=A0A834MHA4_RHYFE|nr:hypothetical protein GWI33_000349 [Rhynchophorus ferrugineus]